MATSDGGKRPLGKKTGAWWLLKRRRRPAGDRATAGCQPQFHHQLGQKSGGRPGVAGNARRKSDVGRGGRTVDVCREKKAPCWLWWAVDRASKCVLGWTLGDRGTETAQRLDAQLPHAAHVTFATDFWHPSGKIFGQDRHIQGKAHTFTIESLNHRIRCTLARRKRRTHSDSKSRKNLAASILFFILKQCGGILGPVPQSISI